MVKAIRIITRIMAYAILGIVVLLAVLLGGTKIVGITPYTVLSGSMEPTYHVGSVIYVVKAEPETLKPGDSITYRISGGTVVTHRIFEVLNEGTADLAFRTKGDAADKPDGSPVSPSAVIGKPIFTIPYLGYCSETLKKPQVLIPIIGVCGAVMILSFAIDGILGKETKKETPKSGEEIR